MDTPDETADRTLRDLEQQSEEVGEHIDETRKDWEDKRQDSSVPGAEPDEDQPAGG